MKTFIILLLFFLYSFYSLAQVGIGTTSPNASAELDVTASDKGILIPRVSLLNTSNATTPINNPATGLMVYNTNSSIVGGTGVGFYFFNGSSWEKIVTSSEQDGTGTDDQTIDEFTLSGSFLNLSLENDGMAAQYVNLSSLKDADWYSVSNTTSNDINDNIYTLGKVKIGLSTFFPSDGTLSVLATDNFGMTISNNRTTATGLFVGLNGTSSSIKTGIEVNLSGTSNSTAYVNSGYKFTDDLNGNQTRKGISQLFRGTNIDSFGVTTGIQNEFTATSDYRGDITGVSNLIDSNGSGRHFGTSNALNGSGNGQQYGNFNTLSGTGFGNKYGSYNVINSAAGGLHYGVYSNVQNATGYAGYFIGRLSLGTDPLFNRYIMPGSDGEANQIIQTDGSGNLNWINATSLGTDDQIVDGFALSGTTLGISLENDGVTPVTVDLSSLQDADFYKSGDTPANNINDDIYTNGKLNIGTSDFSTSTTLRINTSEASGVFIQNNNASNSLGLGIALPTDNTEIKTGLSVTLSGINNSNYISSGIKTNFSTTGADNHFNGIQQNFTGTSVNSGPIGLSNNFYVNSSYRTITGISNNIESEGIGEHIGASNYLSGIGIGMQKGTVNIIDNSANGYHFGIYNLLTGTGSGNKYGSYNIIETTANGTHYGVYSDVQKSTGYAGYFIGRMSLGNATTNRYIMPATDGAANQVIYTDGSGNLNWINATSLGTDDQIVDGFALSGTTLGISLENDGVAPVTVDLASLQDADWYEAGNTPPNDINDAIFTNGKVGIGNPTPTTSLEINGALALTPSAITSLVADTLITVDDRSIIVINNTSGTTWNLTLTNGLAIGQLLYIVGTNTITNTIQLQNLGNLALANGIIPINANDTLSLLWNGAKWVQISFSDN